MYSPSSTTGSQTHVLTEKRGRSPLTQIPDPMRLTTAICVPTPTPLPSPRRPGYSSLCTPQIPYLEILHSVQLASCECFRRIANCTTMKECLVVDTSPARVELGIRHVPLLCPLQRSHVRCVAQQPNSFRITVTGQACAEIGSVRVVMSRSVISKNRLRSAPGCSGTSGSGVRSMNTKAACPMSTGT
jgi:hypothetical protein